MKNMERFNQLTNENSLYSKLNKDYLPSTDEGTNLAEQLVTATNKLIYKWYNDGDVIAGDGNDLTNYANWIDMNFKETQSIFVKAETIYNSDDEDYLNLVLIPLIEFVFDEDRLKELSRYECKGSIYNCGGRFEYNDNSYNYNNDDE